MRLFYSLIAIVLLTSCVNGYQRFYSPYVDVKNLKDVHLLGENEQPQIFATNDINRDIKIARSKYFIPIGYSSFNGEMESQQSLISQARNVGSSLVLLNSKFTETRAITTPLFIPNNQTTHYSGTTDGNINGIYGETNYNGNFNAFTSGSVTTYGTTVVPMTQYQQRYDQNAVFFVKQTRKARVGITLTDLTPELRSQYQMNTGAVIDIVLEDSPAFNANILPGDILISFNGIQVNNAMHFVELAKSIGSNGGKCPIKIIRARTEKTFELRILPLPLGNF